MGIEKQMEFEVEGRSYCVRTSLGNTYDIHGFNALRDQVGIYDDLVSGEKIFVAWGQVPVIRYKDI